MKKALLLGVWAMQSVFCLPLVYAAGSMEVDDAQLLDAHKCQLEGWGRFTRSGTERSLMSSCNFTGNMEFGVGGTWQRDDEGRMFMADKQLQVKTVFTPLSTNGYGIGLSMGVNRQTEAGDEGYERSWGYFANIPVSFSFRDDEVLLHTNIGFKITGVERETRLTWGIGNETHLLDNLSFIGEVVGKDKGKPAYQLGFRTALVPEKVELDLTYGNTFGSDTRERYVVLGLRFISPELF